jgi:hypothetical protein
LSKLLEREELYRLLRARSDELLAEENADSYVAKRDSLDQKVIALKEQLDEPDREYEEYLAALEAWRNRRREIGGRADEAGSITHLEKQLKDLDEVPAKLEKTRGLRKSKASEIYREYKKLADVYREMYGPVQKFIEHHPLAKDRFDLNFEVSIVEKGFEDRFFEYIHRGKSGSFLGEVQSSLLINNILERHDFDSETGILGFLDEVEEHLHYDMKSEPRRTVKVSEQLRQGHTVLSLYNFLFSLEYLEPRYTLRMGDKDLHQLSPGERHNAAHFLPAYR